ncbi:ATP-binding protein [Streptomyces halobius]|uniref:ATP-binding protein n=1 Tax=Streptomyces halobius TaxID=2879846 RepID=A0ABY4M573_9ACTN|nr:ATP-binding protein [Streptomyces halobius]UQA91531.1 ATP-binding protein [Streptomyces halobius]
MASEPRAAWQPLPRQQAFGHTAVSVRAAREFARDTLAGWGISDRVDDVRLCVSELATNALAHASEGAKGFRVGITLDGRLLRVEVHDNGPGMPRRCAPDDDSDTGRGLLLVSDVADDWGSEAVGQHKVVWAEFKVSSPFWSPASIDGLRHVPARDHRVGSRCPPQHAFHREHVEAAAHPNNEGKYE